MHKLVPKLLEKSKTIGKGKSYTEKLNARKAVAFGNARGRSVGANNLEAKKINEGKFLRKVPGIAMTAA